jgi:hypothetical protein
VRQPAAFPSGDHAVAPPAVTTLRGASGMLERVEPPSGRRLPWVAVITAATVIGVGIAILSVRGGGGGDSTRAVESPATKADPPAPHKDVVPPKADPPKPDPVKADPPKVDLPKVDPPKVDPPKVDPPKVDPPKADPPKVDPPKVDPPVVDPPKVDAPAPVSKKPPVDPHRPTAAPKPVDVKKPPAKPPTTPQKDLGESRI